MQGGVNNSSDVNCNSSGSNLQSLPNPTSLQQLSTSISNSTSYIPIVKPSVSDQTDNNSIKYQPAAHAAEPEPTSFLDQLVNQTAEKESEGNNKNEGCVDINNQLKQLQK